MGRSSISRRTSIRTKVTIAMLLVALMPLALVGVVADRSARNAAREQAADRLAGIAAVQEEQVNAYASSNLESLALVASRTQLRLSFAAELDQPGAENVALMQRILGDAVASSAVAQRIELVDPDGRVIASSDGTEVGADRSGEPAFVFGLDGPDLAQVVQRDGERFGLHSRPVALDGEQLGVVLIEASLDPLDQLMTDYTGLGESGESILASGFDQESVQLLGNVRFPLEVANDTIVDDELLVGALAGVEGDVSDQVDYRGASVLAVAHNGDAVPGWALAVKIDRAEALADADRLRNVLLVSFGLAAVAVGAAALGLARGLSRPVLDLHQTATAVAAGDTGRRARVLSNDELAELAVEFNRMTDELTEANARLRLTNEHLEEFVYISSHDLKSPLRSISSFGQLLETKYAGVFDEQGREYVGFIREGAARMHSVLDDLLEYLRIEKEGYAVEPVDLELLIDDVIKLHKPELDRDRADLRRSPLPTIAGSTVLLRQLFDNLVQNAIRYRRPGEPLILEITAERQDDNWQIALADNGIGIPADRREEAFTVFKRLNETGDGSGMGLAICRRIARRHEGEVDITNSLHGGVSLVVTLPSLVPDQIALQSAVAISER